MAQEPGVWTDPRAAGGVAGQPDVAAAAGGRGSSAS